MLGYLKRKYRNHLSEVLSTIKLLEVEERYDIYFSRFYGLYFAKLGKHLSITPTHISLISLFIGVAGGMMLYFQDKTLIVLLGGFLIVLAGVLDSADGQLARMTGQSSDLGRAIDGVIDNLVFMSCYIAGSAYFFPIYGWWIVILTIISGIAHSYKAALYEFYKAEYLLLVGRSEASYIPISIDELKPTGNKWYHKLIDNLYKDYTKKQLLYTTRSASDREEMQRKVKENNEKFLQLYIRLNKKMLFWWAWVSGSNTHRNTLILFAVIGRFDLYLWASLIWTLSVVPLNHWQRKFDDKLLKET